MSEDLNVEEKASSTLKKLSNILENLSSNLSKEKTENAFCEGYGYIKELENIIDNMEQSQTEKYNNIYIIKDDFIKKKEKFEYIQKIYILNKSNQLIESLSTNNENPIEENYDLNDKKNKYDVNDSYIFEEEEDDNSYGKNFFEEYFKENNNLIELNESFRYNDNCLFKIKRMIYHYFLKLNKIMKEISPQIKYLIILILLIILLIFCIIRLYFSIIK